MIINEILVEDPQAGDSIDLQCGDTLIETVIEDVLEDGSVVIKLDETALQLMIDARRQYVAESQGVAEGFLNEASSDEAWELVGQSVPEIQQFVKQMGYGNDEQSVAKITPIIDKAPSTQIPAASIPKLKNLANKGNDAQTLKAIQQISGRPDAAQQYTRLMQARDAGEGRQRDVSGYLQYVKSGNYDPPVLLKLPTGTYVIGGRTRLYAALALGIPANVKIISANNFKQGVAEDEFELDEAEYQGRKVPLGKPMKGDVKKSKVYVKNAKGNVVKVNFGDKNMRIKKSSPSHRKSFRARHHCENPGPRWKARYWSCRAW